MSARTAFGQDLDGEIMTGMTSIWKLIVMGATLLGVLAIVAGGLMAASGRGMQGAYAIIGGIVIAAASALIGTMNGWFGNDFANEFMAP